MTAYFISDLHLSADTPVLTDAFYTFVDKIATSTNRLYILGDFFDAWIGDDEDAAYYVEVQQRLKAYTEKGLEIAFLHGNRDFLIGQRFAEKTGVRLLPEHHDIECAKQKIRLMHGDSLCTSDTEFMAFRAQSRSPAWQAQILSLPLQQRRVMAAQLRAQSKSMNSNKAEDIMDVNPKDVEACFNNSDIDILLHGHTHRPATHSYAFGQRIVLGDWGKTGWYVEADEDNIELIEFAITSA